MESRAALLPLGRAEMPVRINTRISLGFCMAKLRRIYALTANKKLMFGFLIEKVEIYETLRFKNTHFGSILSLFYSLSRTSHSSETAKKELSNVADRNCSMV